MIGKEDVGGNDMYNLKVTNKNGSVKNYYIDAGKYLICQVKATAVSMGKELSITQKMTGYKDFNGIKIATKIISKTPMGDVEIAIEDVDFNTEIDDSIFEKPSN